MFTSEGCSSCPPADAVLATLDAEARAAGAPVYALSFHVDYWDDLGWRDSFSNPAFSARQRAYDRAIQAGVYTPMMLVNGRTPFVGSRSEEARRRRDAALRVPAVAVIALGTVRREGRAVRAAYRVDGLPAGSVVAVALVERRAANAVARGENAGRRLAHVGVVRAFGTARGAAGTVRLAWPEGLTAAGAEIVAFVQDPRTLLITGATSARMEE